jgi:integrase
VLNTLASPASKRAYDFAIDDFVAWYCSEPRLAYEAADTGLLSPELAAGIRRVKGAKRIGVRLGNWLSAEQSRAVIQAPNAETLKGRRDKAILALMFGCGLRRGEVANMRN